jgi:hypothetical protein
VLLVTAIATSGLPTAAALPTGKVNGALIEQPAQYQPQFLCRKDLQPGVAAFRSLVLKAYPTTHSASEVRGCDAAVTSEHQDGRAWDWGVRAKNKKERKTAESLLTWLLAPDEFGNDFAMARRLGIMYIIWNKQMWRAYTGEWGPYACSGVTNCHQDHVHFSFGWAGADKQTSYWTGRVAAEMPPPIPVLGTIGEELRTTVSSKKPHVYGSKSLVGGLLYSLRAKGVWHYGTDGAQQADAACRLGKDGTWQRDRELQVSGVWNLTPTTDTGGGCNTADHTYVATLTPWGSDAITFSLNDQKRTDNSGSVKVLIRRTL